MPVLVTSTCFTTAKKPYQRYTALRPEKRECALPVLKATIRCAASTSAPSSGSATSAPSPPATSRMRMMWMEGARREGDACSPSTAR